MMTRDEAKALQLALLAQGYSLPRWGVDGQIGGETLAAVDRWLADHHDLHTPARSILPEIASAILAAAQRATVELPAGIVDARDGSLLASTVGGLHPRQERRGTNPWPRIDTIVLHQMDCRGSTNPAWRRWSTGDLAIHYAVGRDGIAAWLYDLQACVWHGHGYNGHSVGIEIEGRFPALLATPDPRRTDRLTDEMAAAALACIRHAVAVVASHGGAIRYLAAHRQSWVASKRGDPGEEIWRRVALPAMAEHSLLAARTLPSGAPIPEAWDPRAVGVRY